MSRAFIQKRLPFKPTDIGGCQLWLDGVDPAGTGTPPSNGATVPTWTDKSGSGNSVTLTSSTYSFNSFTGKYGIYFNSNPSSAITLTPYMSFFVSSYWTATFPSNYRGLLGKTPNVFVCGQNDGAGNFMAGILNSTTNVYGSVADARTMVMTDVFYIPSTSFSLLVGCGDLSPTGNPWIGHIYEMIVFNTTLNKVQYQQVESYLAQKWGLQTSLPQGHPGTRGIVYPQTPLQNWVPWRYPSAFVPTSIGNCQLWLDGADSSTVILNGSTVSQWTDKSAAGNNATQPTAGNQPSYSASGIVFAGNQWLITPIGVNPTAESFFIVFKTTNNLAEIFSGTNVNGREVLIIGGVMYLSKYGTNPVGLTPNGGSVSTNTVTLFDYQYTTSLVTLNLNGLQTGSGTPPVTYSGTGTSYIGSSTYAPNNMYGTIYEIIYYNVSLTTNQFQQVEGYLAWKWGLQANLPANHPYKNSSPNITNPGGVSRPPNILPIPPITISARPRSVIQVLISSGLLARYRMNESSGSTVIDSVAGNNITIAGSPSRVSTSYGTYTGYALSIQNATQYGSITLPANMVVGAHSITSWVYLTGFASTGVQCTWVGWGVQCTGENHVAYKNGSVMTLFGGASCIASLNFLDNNTNTVAAQLNTWYFCVTTWDGTNTWKTYCYSPTTAYNFTYSYGMNAVTSGGVFAIGCANGLNNNFAGSGYGGYIGEVRFYNRVLTAGEVASIYAGTG